MKKIISLVIGLILILGCVALPVTAANTVSPEIDDIISDVTAEDDNGDDVDIIITRTDEDDRFKPEKDDEKIIGYYDVIVEGEPKYPITIKADVAGVTESSKPYILVLDENGDIIKVPVEVLDDGTIKFVFEEGYKKFALVVKKKVTSVGTSDQTGDFTTPFAVCIVLTSLAVLGITAKKIKEN